MINTWEINGTDTELNRAERETLLYLHKHEMQTTTDILHACDSIEYRRKALRTIDSLEDLGLIRTRMDDRDDDSPLNPPRLAMLSRSGERFVSDREAEIATADMPRDDLREEVYELRAEVEELESEVDEHRSKVETRIDEVSRKGVHELRSDVDQLADRVSDVEAAVEDRVTSDQLATVQRRVKSDIEDVRSEVGDQINEVAVRVGDVEADVAVLEESVDDMEAWVASTSEWIEDTLIPSVQRVEPLVELYESSQREGEVESDSRGQVEYYDAVEGIRRRLFSQ